MDLENLDLEEVDKEMAIDKASQSTAFEGGALESAPPPPIGDDIAAACLNLFKFVYFFFFFFFGILLFRCPVCFGLFDKYFHSNLRTMFLPSIYVLLIIILKQCWLPVVFGPLITIVILYLLVYFPTLHDTM